MDSQNEVTKPTFVKHMLFITNPVCVKTKAMLPSGSVLPTSPMSEKDWNSTGRKWERGDLNKV